MAIHYFKSNTICKFNIFVELIWSILKIKTKKNCYKNIDWDLFIEYGLNYKYKNK